MSNGKVENEMGYNHCCMNYKSSVSLKNKIVKSKRSRLVISS